MVADIRLIDLARDRAAGCHAHIQGRHAFSLPEASTGEISGRIKLYRIAEGTEIALERCAVAEEPVKRTSYIRGSDRIKHIGKPAV